MQKPTLPVQSVRRLREIAFDFAVRVCGPLGLGLTWAVLVPGMVRLMNNSISRYPAPYLSYLGRKAVVFRLQRAKCGREIGHDTPSPVA
eukprot:1668784-Rhodomonas_salina.1